MEPCRQSRKHIHLIAISLIRRQGDKACLGISFGFSFEYTHQLIGPGDWQRAKQKNINDAEDRCVGSDTQGQRERRNECENWILAQRTRTIAQVLKNISQHACSQSTRPERYNKSFLREKKYKNLLWCRLSIVLYV